MLEAAVAGYLVALSLIAAIGAQNAFVLRQGLRREHVGIVVAICAISDAVLISVGVGGFGHIAQAMPMFKSFQHLVGTSKIVVDGDNATATSILHNPMVLPQDDGPPRTFFVGVWYHDKLVRTPQGWRINERVEELCYFHNAPEGMAPPGA